MTKRSTSIQEDSLSPSLKRTRSNTSQEEHDFTPDTKQKPRGRKSLPGALSLSTSATSVDTPSNAAIRRRMNPDSLAGRLGPDLVKELESLLKPGMTEMPSFTVRQEIQQRYNIDRRHVYDWFHNKGLRVTTSEKREERRAMRAREHAHMPTTRNQAQVCRPPSKRALAFNALYLRERTGHGLPRILCRQVLLCQFYATLLLIARCPLRPCLRARSLGSLAISFRTRSSVRRNKTLATPSLSLADAQRCFLTRRPWNP